jgi:hypothetical protein
MLAVPTIARLADVHQQTMRAEIAHERLVARALLTPSADADRRAVQTRDGIRLMQNVRLAVGYTRYALTSLATIAFGPSTN